MLTEGYIQNTFPPRLLSIWNYKDNRTKVVLYPQKNFIFWIKSIYFKNKTTHSYNERTVYLKGYPTSDHGEQFRIFIVVILGIYFKNNTTNSNNESTVYLKGNRFRICIVASKFLLFSCMHFIQEIIFFC